MPQPASNDKPLKGGAIAVEEVKQIKATPVKDAAPKTAPVE